MSLDTETFEVEVITLLLAIQEHFQDILENNFNENLYSLFIENNENNNNNNNNSSNSAHHFYPVCRHIYRYLSSKKLHYTHVEYKMLSSILNQFSKLCKSPSEEPNSEEPKCSSPPAEEPDFVGKTVSSSCQEPSRSSPMKVRFDIPKTSENVSSGRESSEPDEFFRTCWSIGHKFAAVPESECSFSPSPPPYVKEEEEEEEEEDDLVGDEAYGPCCSSRAVREREYHTGDPTNFDQHDCDLPPRSPRGYSSEESSEDCSYANNTAHDCGHPDTICLDENAEPIRHSCGAPGTVCWLCDDDETLGFLPPGTCPPWRAALEEMDAVDSRATSVRALDWPELDQLAEELQMDLKICAECRGCATRTPYLTLAHYGEEWSEEPFERTILMYCLCQNLEGTKYLPLGENQAFSLDDPEAKNVLHNFVERQKSKNNKTFNELSKL